jgi:hypothetical protein
MAEVFLLNRPTVFKTVSTRALEVGKLNKDSKHRMDAGRVLIAGHVLSRHLLSFTHTASTRLPPLLVTNAPYKPYFYPTYKYSTRSIISSGVMAACISSR